MNLYTIDIAIIVGYLVFCLVIGLVKYGKIQSIRDYTFGTKRFSTVVLIATIFATAVSSGQVIGNIGKVYELGLVFIIPLMFFPVTWLVMSRLIAPNLDKFHKLKFMSLGDIMEHFYGQVGRHVNNVVSVLLSITVIATGAIAIGYLLHYFINIPENWGIFIGISVVTLYSAFGGFASVAFTDVFQFLIFFIALPIACSVGYKQTGGIQDIILSLPKAHLSINKENIFLFLSLLFYSLCPYTSIPYMQRALVAKTQKQFTSSFVMVGVLFIPLLIMVALIGLMAYKISPNSNPNTVFYSFIDHYLTSGVKGLMIAGILAIIMSTQDSYLNTTSSLIAHEVCKKIWPKLTDKQELLIARFACAVLSGCSVLVIFFKKGIVDIMWLIDNFWLPLIEFPLLAGLLGVRVSKKTFNILIVTALSFTVIIRSFTGVFDTRSLVAGVLTSIIVLYFGNRSYKKKHPKVIQKKTASASLIMKLKNSILKDDFSSHFLYGVSLILGAGLVMSTFFLNLQKVTFLNVSFITSATLFILLLLGDLWSDKSRKYILYIWKVVLIFTLLVLPPYIFIVSKSYFLGIVNILLSYILFAQFTNKTKTAILAVLSFSISYIISRYQSNADYFVVTQTFLLSCTGIITMTIIMMLYQSRFVAREVIRQLDLKVQERTSALKKALSAKQEFLNKVSHEMRTPLHGIIGISSGLDSSWDRLSEEEKRRYVRMISEGSNRLKDYASNILDLASIEQDRFTLKLQDNVNLLAIAQDAIKSARYLVLSSHKEIQVKLNVQKTIPLLRCNPIRITQVLNNLLNNAVQYSERGIITLSIVQQRSDIVISVADHGIGIPDNEKHKIFNPFYESSRTKTLAKGKGLGLAIVKELVDLHQGRIVVIDNVSKGAIFSVYLPMT